MNKMTFGDIRRALRAELVKRFPDRKRPLIEDMRPWDYAGLPEAEWKKGLTA